MHKPEIDAVIRRYARRDDSKHYSPGSPGVREMALERSQAVSHLFADVGWSDLSMRRALEVGCGEGNVLSELLQMGFAPDNLTGIELLPERLAKAREKLPDSLRLIPGDASEAAIEPLSQDLVLQHVVFSSLLDDVFQQQLASAMWRWVRPGGAILWYDFTVDNPRNKDVRGVSLTRVHSLFPEGRITASRLTLAPPIARAVCRIHPALYGLLASVPLLRTHILAWIVKPLS